MIKNNLFTYSFYFLFGHLFALIKLGTQVILAPRTGNLIVLNVPATGNAYLPKSIKVSF